MKNAFGNDSHKAEYLEQPMELKGILPALITPFDGDDRVDHDTLADILEYQLKAGVSGFVALGTTGEAYALSHEERGDVLKTVKSVVGDRGTLIAGASGFSTRGVIEQAKQAADAGYEAVLLAPPPYVLPSQEELIGHYRAVMEAVPDVNVVLYNFPARTVVEVGYSVLDAFRDNERVIGIKESSGDVLRAIKIGTEYPQYQLSCGSDDQALDFFLWGASSWICGPANCFTEQVVDFYNRFTNGDIDGARQVMIDLFPAMASLEEGKFNQKIKYGCELAGFDAARTRLPLQPLTEEEKAEFRKLFEASRS